MIELSVNSQMKIELRENPNLLYLRIAMFREVRYSSTCLDNLVSLKWSGQKNRPFSICTRKKLLYLHAGHEVFISWQDDNNNLLFLAIYKGF